jgi:ribosomal protein L11 methyltransferase
MDYIELKCHIPKNTDEARDILAVELGELGYESFQEYEYGLLAFIRSADFVEGAYMDIYCVKENIFGQVVFTHQLYKDRNWNAYWEKNFNPVEVGENILIRAPFHKVEKKYGFEIVLEPKMSFGTGHHATTWLMIHSMEQLEMKGKSVLDIGCGTGILAIFAAMKGAGRVVGFDNNDWAYHNALENLVLNKAENVDILLGEITTIPFNQLFDLVLANINRNVILEDMGHYLKQMAVQGEVLFSGILAENLNEVHGAALSHGLSLVEKAERDNWLVLHYLKG